MYFKKTITIVTMVFFVGLIAQASNTPETKTELKASKQFELGMEYIKGENVKVDNELGISLLTKAAENNHEKAQIYLTRAYLTGYKVKKNNKKAFYWATKAAQMNNPEAQMRLANMYFQGKGTPKNVKKGIALLIKAKNQGYVKAKESWDKMNLE